ncbi:MAG: hypothetical protein AABY22_01805 [Nanoarchaeota archaeon]
MTIKQNRIWLNNRNLFVHAAKASPNSAWARTNLAAIYFKENKFYQAKNEINLSLKISENYPFTLNIYAKLKWREKELEEAEAAFKKALEFDKNGRNHRDLYRSLAILKLETKNHNEALNYITDTLSSTAFGDVKKAVYLDNLLLSYIDSLSKNKPSVLSDSENGIVKFLIAHVKGSE